MKCPLCQQTIKIQGKFCPKCGKQIFGLPVQPGESLDAPPPQQPAAPPPPSQPLNAPSPVPPAPPTAPWAPPPTQPVPPPPIPRRSAFAPPGPGASYDDDTLDITLEPMDEIADFGPPTRRPMPAPMTGSVPTTTATDAEIGKTCPYCRFPIKIGAPVAVCDACKTPHHQDCWQENGGCTSYGCARAPGARPQPVATAAGYPASVTVAPRRSAGSAIADALILAELDRSAGNALTYALIGLLCCPIFSVVGVLMGFSTLASISRSALAAPAARTKAIIAIVVGFGVIIMYLVGMLMSAQGGLRYQGR